MLFIEADDDFMSNKNEYPLINAVIAVYNRADHLHRLFKSFKILDYSGKINIYVIDDASTENYEYIFDEFRKECPYIELHVIRLSENVGPATARNIALKEIKAGYVWFLDSDAEIFQSEMLKKAVEIFSANPCVKGVGNEAVFLNGELYTSVGKRYPNGFFYVSYMKFDDLQPTYRSTISTANLIMPKNVLDEIGFFNPLMTMSEDVELCYRIIKRGFKLYSCKEVTVYHHMSKHGRSGSAFDFYNDLKEFTKTAHLNRVKILALHKKHVLIFLPILDLFFGVIVMLNQVYSKRSLIHSISKKRNNDVKALEYAAHQFFGMIKAYFYAYRILFLRDMH